MKKLLLLFLFTQTLAIAQPVNERIEAQFLTYSQRVIDRKTDESLDYVNPELFKAIPRETLKSAMEMVYGMTFIEYKASLPTLSDFSPPKNIDGITYVKFMSHSIVEMKFLPNPDDAPKSAEEELAFRQMLFASFEAKFGVGNVAYNEKSEFYEIKTNKAVVATSDAEMKDWKFVIVDNPKMKTILEGFIPSEFLE